MKFWPPNRRFCNETMSMNSLMASMNSLWNNYSVSKDYQVSINCKFPQAFQYVLMVTSRWCLSGQPSLKYLLWDKQIESLLWALLNQYIPSHCRQCSKAHFHHVVCTIHQQSSLFTTARRAEDDVSAVDSDFSG